MCRNINPACNSLMPVTPDPVLFLETSPTRSSDHPSVLPCVSDSVVIPIPPQKILNLGGLQSPQLSPTAGVELAEVECSKALEEKTPVKEAIGVKDFEPTTPQLGSATSLDSIIVLLQQMKLGQDKV